MADTDIDRASGTSRWSAETLSRRQFLHLTAGAATLPAMSRIARAQAYPTRAVRIVVGFAAGGPQDTVARLMGHWLSERLGQQFFIENRLGAGGNIAAEAVVHAPPDGYTLLQVSVPNAIGATLYDRLNFNFIQDIAPVASIMRATNVMVVTPSLPVNSVPEFIAYAKANPGKINFASAGNGALGHAAGALFKMMAGVNMVHVPYRGEAPALTDVLAGQAQIIFANLLTCSGYIRAGKLRLLAVTASRRLTTMPDIPTVGEFVPGYEVSGWQGLGAPRNTPAEIVDKLNKDINAGLADPQFKARLADLHAAAFAGSPADFGKFIADETEKWAKVIRAANMRA
jgi:tripartite-type tricarboxylate transporter receptor subunit TctC